MVWRLYIRRLKCSFIFVIILSCLIATTAMLLLYGDNSHDKNGSILSQSCLNIFGDEELFALFDKRNIKIPQTYIFKVKRNSKGTKLLVDMNGVVNNSFWVMDFSNGIETRRLEKPASIAYVDNECNFVAWSDSLSQRIHFACGVTLPLSISSRIGFDPSSSYFFITESGITKIAYVNDPSYTLLKTKIHATHIFLHNNRLYILGYCANGHFISNQVVYQSYRIREKKAVAEDEGIINCPCYFCRLHVVDMDLVCETLVLKSHYDSPLNFLSSWYTYDLRSKKMQKYDRVGKSKQYALFLSENILGALNNNE